MRGEPVVGRTERLTEVLNLDEDLAASCVCYSAYNLGQCFLCKLQS